MDLVALTAFLAPLLPTLLRAGGKAVDGFAGKAGEEAVGVARRIWDKLRGRVEARPAALEAATDVAQNPDDEDLRTVLRVQLKKLLEDDPQLAAEVDELWQQARAVQANTVTASGTRNVAIGGDVSGSSIRTGGADPRD
jgi:hypothetical protein